MFAPATVFERRNATIHVEGCAGLRCIAESAPASKFVGELDFDALELVGEPRKELGGIVGKDIEGCAEARHGRRSDRHATPLELVGARSCCVSVPRPDRSGDGFDLHRHEPQEELDDGFTAMTGA